MDDLKRFFLNPTHATHKRYEAIRALCVEGLLAKEVADRFGYSIHSINTIELRYLFLKEPFAMSGDIGRIWLSKEGQN